MASDLYFGSRDVSVALIVAVAFVASFAVVAFARRRGLDPNSAIGRLGMVWLIAALAAVAILTLQPGPGGFGSALPSIPNPLSRARLPDARANVMLYLPVGFFAALVWRSKSRPVARAAILAFSISLAIELAQWVLPISRAAETHDVVANTIGGFLGAVAGTVIVLLVRKSRQALPGAMNND